MEPAIRAQFTDDVHARVARAVGVDTAALVDIGGFESYVHETVVAGKPRIVRSTWHARRSREELGAELHFIGALADEGVPACRALPLASGELLATAPSEAGAFHICSFEKAPGTMLPREAWTDETFEVWGALAGRMHRVGAAYAGPPPPLRRASWEQEYAEIEAIVAADPPFRSALADVLDRIRALPRSRATFGPMHTDLHAHNLFWHEGKPHVFDFDDMLDFWFVADLAIILYYAVMSPIWSCGDRQADYDQAKEALLRGYAREYTLPAGELDTLPLFLDLREQTLRAVIVRSVLPEERSEFWTRYLADAEVRIRAGAPALGLRA
jgi:Ser/Thr protein kinase RdoA (MazF antagonist)